MKREPSLEVVAGAQGIGKTWLTKQIARSYIMNDIKTGQYGRPVLVFDVRGEYEGFYPIDFDVDEEDDYKRGKNIRKIKNSRLYKIIAFKKNGQPMSIDEVQKTCITIGQNFRDGLLILDDFNNYFIRTATEKFVGFITGLRHVGVDCILQLQSLRPMTPRLWQNATYIRLHKQSDDVIGAKNKIKNLELVLLAQTLIDYKYKNRPNKKVRYCDFCCWVDLLNDRLIAVSKSDFVIACKLYLQQNSKIIKNVMQFTDESGKKICNTYQSAVEYWIKDKIDYIN